MFIHYHGYLFSFIWYYLWWEDFFFRQNGVVQVKYGNIYLLFIIYYGNCKKLCWNCYIIFYIKYEIFSSDLHYIKKKNRLLWTATPSKRITQLLTKMCTALSAEGEMKANLRQQPFSVLRSLFHQPDDG